MITHLLTIALLIGAIAAKPAAGESAPDVCQSRSPALGRTLFQDNCVACHGPAGKGGGQLAEMLGITAPDLTTLTKRGTGVFPAAHVMSVLQQGGRDTPDGDKIMPAWATIFEHECGREYAKAAINALERHLEGMQGK